MFRDGLEFMAFAFPLHRQKIMATFIGGSFRHEMVAPHGLCGKNPHQAILLIATLRHYSIKGPKALLRERLRKDVYGMTKIRRFSLLRFCVITLSLIEETDEMTGSINYGQRAGAVLLHEFVGTCHRG